MIEMNTMICKNQNHVLLIDTPSNVAAPADPWRLHLPLGAIYLGKALRRNNIAYEIYDPKLSGRLQEIETIYYYGDSLETIKDTILKKNPYLLCVTNLFSKDANTALEICRIVKRANPKIKVALGGPHATVAPEDFLVEGGPDVVAIGEGEETIIDISEWACGKITIDQINGVAWRKDDGTVIKNSQRELIKDLHETVGFPDYSDIDLEQYFSIWKAGAAPRRIQVQKRFLPVISSRGCPYKCSFCSVYASAGRKFRVHSAEETVSHIEYLVSKYQIAAFDFEDDNLSFDRERFEQIVHGLIKIKPRLQWGTPNGVRADTLLDKNLLKNVKKSGCQYLTIGVESGNQKFLNSSVKKALDLNKVVHLAQLCKEVGIPLNGFFIIGFPNETLSQIQDTVSFARLLNSKYGVFTSFSYCMPIKGTKIYEECLQGKYLTEEITAVSLTQSAYLWGKGKIKTPEFTPELLKNIMQSYNKEMLYNYFLFGLRNPLGGLRLIKIALKNSKHVLNHFFKIHTKPHMNPQTHTVAKINKNPQTHTATQINTNPQAHTVAQIN